MILTDSEFRHAICLLNVVASYATVAAKAFMYYDRYVSIGGCESGLDWSF